MTARTAAAAAAASDIAEMVVLSCLNLLCTVYINLRGKEKAAAGRKY
jgi:hypothetical protein